MVKIFAEIEGNITSCSLTENTGAGEGILILRNPSDCDCQGARIEVVFLSDDMEVWRETVEYSLLPSHSVRKQRLSFRNLHLGLKNTRVSLRAIAGVIVRNGKIAYNEEIHLILKRSEIKYALSFGALDSSWSSLIDTLDAGGKLIATGIRKMVGGALIWIGGVAGLFSLFSGYPGNAIFIFSTICLFGCYLKFKNSNDDTIDNSPSRLAHKVANALALEMKKDGPTSDTVLKLAVNEVGAKKYRGQVVLQMDGEIVVCGIDVNGDLDNVTWELNDPEPTIQSTI